MLIFIVDQRKVLSDKNQGHCSRTNKARMTVFNPDKTWKALEPYARKARNPGAAWGRMSILDCS